LTFWSRVTTHPLFVVNYQDDFYCRLLFARSSPLSWNLILFKENNTRSVILNSVKQSAYCIMNEVSHYCCDVNESQLEKSPLRYDRSCKTICDAEEANAIQWRSEQMNSILFA